MMTQTRKKRPVVKKEEEVLDPSDFLFDDEEGEEEEEVEAKPARKKKRPSASVDPMTQAIQTAKKLHDVRNAIAGRVFEREDVLNDMFRALIAGENILLLGPPGTGKTLLAEIFVSFVEKADIFKWLMNRTTDPADIVGPYSIKAMENDQFLRVTTGKLPEAHFGFLDEIFKANEPVMNFMLSMLNEGVFYNDGQAVPVQLRMVMGASNEYPETDDLEAFYDRFVFRHWVNYIQDPQNRMAMGKASRDSKKNAAANPVKLTLDEVDNLQAAVHQVAFPDKIAKDFDRLYRSLETQGIKISDRRYTKAQKIMMANALYHGRQSVTGDDFRCLKHVLWNKDVSELDIIEAELARFVNPFEAKVKELLKQAQAEEARILAIENRTERAGEAVEANAVIDEILSKMEKQIEEAEQDGVDVTELEKMATTVDGILNTIAKECLKQSSRRNAKRSW